LTGGEIPLLDGGSVVRALIADVEGLAAGAIDDPAAVEDPASRQVGALFVVPDRLCQERWSDHEHQRKHRPRQSVENSSFVHGTFSLGLESSQSVARRLLRARIEPCSTVQFTPVVNEGDR
jgi:hypothetical protein